MSEHIRESRHLPASHARRLSELEKGPREFDGRSVGWTEQLAETGFIEVEATKEKKKTTIRVAITPRGLNAIERDRRGVDPYLVMTA